MDDGVFRIYMDCCCYNRQSDDQTYDKIRIETDTVNAILRNCSENKYILVGSDIVLFEILKTPDLVKIRKAMGLYKIHREHVKLCESIRVRANETQKYGLKPLDSLHFASAEYAKVDVLLTVDKSFAFNAKQIPSNMKIENPINWFMLEDNYDE
jgi:predicted nucleic acid-binding protein